LKVETIESRHGEGSFIGASKVGECESSELARVKVIVERKWRWELEVLLRISIISEDRESGERETYHDTEQRLLGD
jgi:hypothetical protein